MKARYVALMRGINVGGKNKLPMKELVAFFHDSDASNARSYIQSGNVVFDCGAGSDGAVAARVTSLVSERFGFSVPIVLRSAADFEDAVKRHPFVAEAADDKHLHIGFLAGAPTDDGIGQLDPDRSPGDSFSVSGREVFFHVPGGMARTKLTTDYFDRRLDTIMTVRNWRTVNRLLEMLGEA